MAEMIVDSLEVGGIEHQYPCPQLCQLASLFQLLQIVAIEGTGKGIVAGEVVESLVETASFQVGKYGQQQKRNSQKSWRRLAEYCPEQRQQPHLVYQPQRGIGDSQR